MDNIELNLKLLKQLGLDKLNELREKLKIKMKN